VWANGRRPFQGDFNDQCVIHYHFPRGFFAEITCLLGVLSPEALETLLETQQYKDCFAALGLEQPPPHFTTVDAVSNSNLKARVTIITMSFAYPATPEQREIFKNHVGGVPIPKRFYEGHSAGPGWTKILMPRGARSWVCEPQKLPDGREVENALTFQPWLRQEMEEFAVGEELELRERWKSAVVSRLGLLAISVDRYDFYPIY
jgi:hypothetical protein